MEHNSHEIVQHSIVTNFKNPLTNIRYHYGHPGWVAATNQAVGQ